jgi:hypothetical protein
MKRTTTTRKAKLARAKRATKPVQKTKAPPKAAARADPIDAMIAAEAQALGLSLEPAWRAGVAFNLRLILRLGALVDEFKLPDDAEPAPVFHA